jgi:hypothetical protein
MLLAIALRRARKEASQVIDVHLVCEESACPGQWQKAALGAAQASRSVGGEGARMREHLPRGGKAHLPPEYRPHGLDLLRRPARVHVDAGEEEGEESKPEGAATEGAARPGDELPRGPRPQELLGRDLELGRLGEDLDEAGARHPRRLEVRHHPRLPALSGHRYLGLVLVLAARGPGLGVRLTTERNPGAAPLPDACAPRPRTARPLPSRDLGLAPREGRLSPTSS